MKICSICGTEKDFSCFFREASKKDGFRNNCKECSVHNKNYAQVLDGIREKTCQRCKLVLPLEKFTSDLRRPLGYGIVCIACAQIKLCRKCQESKPLNDFFRSDRSADGYAYQCKECVRKYRRERYAGNSEAILRKNYQYRHNKKTIDGRRERMLQQKYGLSLDQYEALLIAQDYKCKICKHEEGERGRAKLAVDHDHKTGKIRGLLCDPCNRGIGMLLDDPNIILNAYQYILDNI